MTIKEKIQNVVNSNVHKNIIMKIYQNHSDSRKFEYLDFMLSTYATFKKEKQIMRNKNIIFEDYFVDSFTAKDFEKFSDGIYEAIFNTKKEQYIHRVFSNKYKTLLSDNSESIIAEIAANCISINDFQKYIGRKIAAIKNKDELEDVLSQFLESKINWSPEYVENKIKQKKLIEGYDYDFVYNKDNILAIEIYTFRAANSLGNHMWCIQRDYETYEEYVVESSAFKFIFNFNLPVNNDYSLIAGLYNFNGELHSIYNKQDDEIELSYNNHFKKEEQKTIDVAYIVPETKKEQLLFWLKSLSKRKEHYALVDCEEKSHVKITELEFQKELFKGTGCWDTEISVEELKQFPVLDLSNVEDSVYCLKNRKEFKEYLTNIFSNYTGVFFYELDGNVTLKHKDLFNLFSFLNNRTNEHIAFGLFHVFSLKNLEFAKLFFNENKKEALDLIKDLNPVELASMISGKLLYFLNNETKYELRKEKTFIQELNETIGFNLFEEANVSRETLVKAFVILSQSVYYTLESPDFRYKREHFNKFLGLNENNESLDFLTVKDSAQGLFDSFENRFDKVGKKKTFDKTSIVANFDIPISYDFDKKITKIIRDLYDYHQNVIFMKEVNHKELNALIYGALMLIKMETITLSKERAHDRYVILNKNGHYFVRNDRKIIDLLKIYIDTFGLDFKKEVFYFKEVLENKLATFCTTMERHGLIEEISEIADLFEFELTKEFINSVFSKYKDYKIQVIDYNIRPGQIPVRGNMTYKHTRFNPEDFKI